ncbi:hypothetical protein RTH74_15220 [Pseudomonas sp. zfem001]|uniref:hypothetical protein n=1 Tax=Pseudomonas sp. zfem001 TaxID=3078196 RepID=UPI0029293FAF|nr:hypothetical protein [Pseudomonas sp. zfem001]MDU9408953.1 hypothetical protein [Pseudomonas sp. zfem001]
MLHRPIHDAVMNQALRRAKECHPTVAERHADELARYARLTSACEALESFLGCRPLADEDVFGMLAQRRTQIANLLALANLEAYEQEAEPGLYLAIPFFDRCADKQPVFLVNRTTQRITYIRRSMYAFASTDDGVDEYRTVGSAFTDGIAAGAVIEPGEKFQVDNYSMSWDGDFVSNRRVVLLVDGERGEWWTSVSKLAGYLWDGNLHGLHLLKMVKSL